MSSFLKSAAQSVRERLSLRMRTHGAYQRLFATEDGQLVLRHLIKTGFIIKPTFVRGDTHETSLNEGKRLLVLSILKYIHKDSEKLRREIEEGLKYEDIT